MPNLLQRIIWLLKQSGDESGENMRAREVSPHERLDASKPCCEDSGCEKPEPGGPRDSTTPMQSTSRQRREWADLPSAQEAGNK
jgi:hypothetical protein